jgi:mannose/cellobiose epimerase-like protein (N-acyl-D-glucosamine 2-epimerase family)
MGTMRKVFWLLVLVLAISSTGYVEVGGQRKPTSEGGNRGGQRGPDMRGFMQKLNSVYTDTQNGGVYSACSADFSKVVDSSKRAGDQFVLARSYVFQHVASGRPEPEAKAVELVNLNLKRFEDSKHGGYSARASEDWTVLEGEKDLEAMGEIFDTLMHLYERTDNDDYLLRSFGILDLVLEKGEDKENGGIFDSFAEDWTPTSKTKSLKTQMEVIQDLGSSWKNGIDSPYAVRAERYKKKSMELADLVIEKMYDTENGGFFKTCNADWSVKDEGKDSDAIASAISALFFHYQNRGPVFWGPRKGSHAYRPTRVIHDSYSYRGPGPNPKPISKDAYRVGRLVLENARLLMEKAWDRANGGFVQSCTRDWKPLDKTKTAATQTAVVVALNIAYKMSGDPAIRKTLSEEVEVLSKKGWDAVNGGYYDGYSEDWLPTTKEKTFSANMGLIGVIGMVTPTIRDPAAFPAQLKVWIEPHTLTIQDGGVGQYTVTVQNQGFSREKVRIGGMFAMTRWMEPRESIIELEPHQLHTYDLKLSPPKGLAGNSYPFEISVMSPRDKTKYFSDVAVVSIK